MFRKFSVAALLSIMCIYSCSKKNQGAVQPVAPTAGQTPYTGYALRGTNDDYSASIPVDSANRMIGSYLTSIGYPGNDSSLRSLSFDADSMRAYLKNPNVKTVKLMLAHQPAYINSRYGQFAGMNPQALTVVIVGVNSTGSYVKNAQNEVYEHCSPCPVHCDGNTDAYIY